MAYSGIIQEKTIMHERLLGAECALQVALRDEQDFAMPCMKRVDRGICLEDTVSSND